MKSYIVEEITRFRVSADTKEEAIKKVSERYNDSTYISCLGVFDRTAFADVDDNSRRCMVCGEPIGRNGHI